MTTSSVNGAGKASGTASQSLDWKAGNLVR